MVQLTSAIAIFKYFVYYPNFFARSVQICLNIFLHLKEKMADRDIWELSFEDRFRSVMDQYMDKEQSCPATRGKAIGSQLDRSAKVLSCLLFV
mgnify:CR=1 FL=1